MSDPYKEFHIDALANGNLCWHFLADEGILTTQPYTERPAQGPVFSTESIGIESGSTTLFSSGFNFLEFSKIDIFQSFKIPIF